MGTGSLQWPEVVSAVSSSLSVVITAIMTAVIYRLGKRDTAEQRRQEREFSRRMKAYEAVGRLHQQIYRGVHGPDDHKRLIDAILEFLTHVPELNTIPRDRGA